MVSSFRPAALKVPDSVGPTQAGFLSLADADIIHFSAPYPRSASVVWSPPPNLNHLLGLLKRKSFPPVRHKEIDPTPLLAHIEPHEIIQYLRGEKKLPRRGGGPPHYHVERSPRRKFIRSHTDSPALTSRRDRLP